MNPTRLGLLTRLKWSAFRGLEWLGDRRGSAVTQADIPTSVPPRPSLWVFVSTIGELNATEPLLQALFAARPDLQLILITDHPHYRESYQARYPHARIVVSQGHSQDAQRLAQNFPPAHLLIAEIPVWPSDAPCRFSFAFLKTAKQYKAPICLINGWLYHYRPACRMDAIEYRLFRRDYIRLLDLACVQNKECARALLEAGADAQRIRVVGNLKFDAMQRADWSLEKTRSPRMLAALAESGRPVIVAGCVTEYAEQQSVLDAFVMLRRDYPEALLVLAPRHPEVAERMHKLRDFYAERKLAALFRSQIEDTPLPANIACLTLDTIGELRDFYAIADLTHVGVDHNILEPLSFDKPVTVLPGWERTYPSYPVYLMLHQTGGVLQMENRAELAKTWLELIADKTKYGRAQERLRAAAEQARGSCRRHLRALNKFFQNPQTLQGLNSQQQNLK